MRIRRVPCGFGRDKPRQFMTAADAKTPVDIADMCFQGTGRNVQRITDGGIRFFLGQPLPPDHPPLRCRLPGSKDTFVTIRSSPTVWVAGACSMLAILGETKKGSGRCGLTP